MRLSKLKYDQLTELRARAKKKREMFKPWSDPNLRLGWIADKYSVELNYKAFYGGDYDRHAD